MRTDRRCRGGTWWTVVLTVGLTLACAGCGTPRAAGLPPELGNGTGGAASAPAAVVDVGGPAINASDVAIGDQLLPVVPAESPFRTGSPGVPATLDPDGAPDIGRAQARLAELRYYSGPVDGLAGHATTTALQAFQKVQGLPVDGALGPATSAALANPILPALHAGLADRIEIDLDLQVMFVVLDGDLARIMPVSTGNGDGYRLPGGGRARSLTPVGTFSIERTVAGRIDAYFGTLYDAMYFHQGWAIHGSGNVPPVPASHGCVRLPRPDAEWLFSQVGVGTAVHIVGDRNSFDPAKGESAGTDRPAGEVQPSPSPPSPPPPPPPTLGSTP